MGIILGKTPEQMKEEAMMYNKHFDVEIDVNGSTTMLWRRCISSPSGPLLTEEWASQQAACKDLLVNLGCAVGHPSFVMNNPFPNWMRLKLT